MGSIERNLPGVMFVKDQHMIAYDSVMITCWSVYLITCWYSSRVVQWNMKHIKSTGLARSKAQRYAHWVLSSMHHSFKGPRGTPKSPLKLRKSPAPKKVSRGDGTYLVFPRYMFQWYVSHFHEIRARPFFWKTFLGLQLDWGDELDLLPCKCDACHQVFCPDRGLWTWGLGMVADRFGWWKSEVELARLFRQRASLMSWPGKMTDLVVLSSSSSSSSSS